MMAEKRDKKGKASKKEKEKMPVVINIWGIAGRQEIMDMRRLWQLRIPRK
jgi:hypothetical protein